MAASIDQSRDDGTTVSFGQSLARSTRFKSLFAEGMALVEEAATYLDGPGRADSTELRTGLKGAYAAESMRLTTRLMQIASWLLVRRAIVDGEMTPHGTEQDRTRVTLTVQDSVCAPPVFAELPVTLQSLTRRSLRLQTRILHLDRMVNTVPDAPLDASPSVLDRQIALLQSAFTTPR